MSAQFDLYSIVSRSPDMVVDEIDGELVMISLKEDAFYGLNDVGAEIWDWREEPSSIEEIIGHILEEHDVSKELIFPQKNGHV